MRGPSHALLGVHAELPVGPSVGAGPRGWNDGGHLEREDDDLVARGVALQAGVAVGLEARVGRKGDLLLPRILRHPTRRERLASRGMGGAAWVGALVELSGWSQEGQGGGC